MKNRAQNIILLSLILAFYGCSNLDTIGMKEHSFNKSPLKIVWLQVPGLSLEHLAMLRFSYASSEQLTAFEEAKCIGAAWNYNFYDLRPRAQQSFMAQMTGSQNIKGKCSDFSKKPVWNYLEKEERRAYVVELGVSEKDTLSQAWDCEEEGPTFRRNLILIKMAKAKRKKAQYFHYLSTADLGEGVYFDKTCQQGGCFATLTNNVKSLWEKSVASEAKAYLIIRDFRYLNALKAGKIVLASEVLSEIERVYKYFLENLSSRENLLLLTSAEVNRFEFPTEGEKWEEFMKRGRNILFRRSALLSPVTAWGGRSENFCGIYEEADVFERILWKKQAGGIFPLKLNFL